MSSAPVSANESILCFSIQHPKFYEMLRDEMMDENLPDYKINTLSFGNASFLKLVFRFANICG